MSSFWKFFKTQSDQNIHQNAPFFSNNFSEELPYAPEPL